MRTKRANIDDFMNRTKVDLVSGYRKQVDFVESTAWELILCYDFPKSYKQDCFKKDLIVCHHFQEDKMLQ